MARILDKMANGDILVLYPEGSMTHIANLPGAVRCHGCDEPASRDVVRYKLSSGEHHMFHLLCDSLRLSLAAQELSRQIQQRARDNRAL